MCMYWLNTCQVCNKKQKPILGAECFEGGHKPDDDRGYVVPSVGICDKCRRQQEREERKREREERMRQEDEMAMQEMMERNNI